MSTSSCRHRFYQELLPTHPCEFLFVGTFNPSWDVAHGDNPDFFYSRDANECWCILPHAFNENCLIDKGRKEKEDFCKRRKVGFTDLILSVDNICEDDKNSIFLKRGFKDEDFEGKREELGLKITFFTDEIIQYVEENKQCLKAVFLTRKTKTSIPTIWKAWLDLKRTCADAGIVAKELPSPSPRGGAIRKKIVEWRSEIENIK